MGRALTIGDGVADIIRLAGGGEEWHPGGAALNLAVGLSRLGHRSVLAGRIGSDRNGFRLMRYLREEGVKLINFPSADFTAVAISDRENGEPHYRFNPAIFRRRVAFTSTLMAAMAAAEIVAINTFPFYNAAQAAELAENRKAVAGLFIMDPNPRRNQIRDLDAFRRGFESNLPHSFLVKLSVEDTALLYSPSEEGVAQRLLSLGATRVLLTRGSEGASLYISGLQTQHVPSAIRPDEVVDTLGAGDATLAAVIDWIFTQGVPQTAEKWQGCLQKAMRVAGATCRSAGGGLVKD